jgi:pilus assembly protein FimV
MSFRPQLRSGLIASVLVCAAVSSAAVTLGRSRGVALIGRTLDVAIPVTLDSPGQAADLCAEADVFHGDTRVDASRVTAQVEPGNGLNAVLRVRSSFPVDEPVVTVYLRLGCSQKMMRRYVLLAEEPGETAVPLAPPLAARAPVPVPAQAAQPAQETQAAAAPSATARGTPPRTSSRTRRADEAAAATPRTAAAGRAERSAAPVPAQGRTQAQPEPRTASRAPRSRLSLDLLDASPIRDPRLRATPGLAGLPTTSEQVRAEAAALWRSINAQPQDVLRDLQRVQTLESDVKGLRAQVDGNGRTLAELREQLNQARAERSLTLGAIALLALLLAAAAVTWWLRRSERAGSGEWWRRRDPAAPAGTAGAPSGPTGPASPTARKEMDLRVDESMFDSLKPAPRGPQPLATAKPAVTPTPTAPRAVPGVIRAKSHADSRGGPPSSFHSSFNSSQMASMRMVRAEELVDIQQQADFFMSLGQTEQAIEVLESHIQNNAETSALVWLDLLAIYRGLKRRQDYELLRSDFQRVFNAEVPGYDSTPTVSGGLEDYPRALSRIAALWPSPKVMDVIEESIFRRPGMGEGEPFDLEAYRELVMLYNLGREVVQPEAVPVQEEWVVSEPRSSFFETSMQPLSVTRSDGASQFLASVDLDVESELGGPTNLGVLDEQPLDLDSLVQDEEPHTTTSGYADPQMPRPSPRLGLDIDLSAPPESESRPAADTHSIDFELSGPDDEHKPGKQ